MNDTTKAPAWFEQEIRNGIASLYLLCLDGSPGSDLTAAMTEVWLRDLWASPRREWHAEADTPCIRKAFATLRATCHRWPAPAKFWEAMPARAPTTDRALPAKVFTLEERRQNLKRLADMGKELFGDLKPTPQPEPPAFDWASIERPEPPSEEQAS